MSMLGWALNGSGMVKLILPQIVNLGCFKICQCLFSTLKPLVKSHCSPICLLSHNNVYSLSLVVRESHCGARSALLGLLRKCTCNFFFSTNKTFVHGLRVRKPRLRMEPLKNNSQKTNKLAVTASCAKMEAGNI